MSFFVKNCSWLKFHTTEPPVPQPISTLDQRRLKMFFCHRKPCRISDSAQVILLLLVATFFRFEPKFIFVLWSFYDFKILRKFSWYPSLFIVSPLYLMAVFGLESIFYKLDEKQEVRSVFRKRRERRVIWFYLKSSPR